jgi:hypothetical protein
MDWLNYHQPRLAHGRRRFLQLVVAQGVKSLQRRTAALTPFRQRLYWNSLGGREPRPPFSCRAASFLASRWQPAANSRPRMSRRVAIVNAFFMDAAGEDGYSGPWNLTSRWSLRGFL